MKKVTLIALTLLAFVFTGCETVPEDPNVTKDHRWIGGAIGLEARKVDERTYIVIARGAGACTEADVTKAWVYMADKMAAGKPYDKETKVLPYKYSAPGPYMTTHHKALMVVGKIVIK